MYVMLISVIILLLPFSADINGFIDVKERKIYYGLYILRYFKLYGGNAEMIFSGLKININSYKTIIAPYKQSMDTETNFKLSSGFFIKKVHTIIEYGDKEDMTNTIFVGSFLHLASSIIFSYFNTKNPKLKLKNNILILENDDKFTITIRITMMFSLLSIILALIKIIIKELSNNEKNRERKQQN